MSSSACRLLTILLAALTLPLAAQQPAGTVTPAPLTEFTPDNTPPHGTYPEIVRLSMAEGDVRIARGKQDAKLTGNTWEHAVTGIPLESGFNLVTGADGRAEIEFEDASTIYLAPNSALSLAELTTKDGVPHSTLSLLSGSAVLNIKPNLPGDTYRIETPTHAMVLTYGDDDYARVTSYLDGLQVTPMEDTHLTFNRVPVPVKAGVTYNVNGYSATRSRVPQTPEFIAFNDWVKERVASRDAAMKSVMQQADLKTPLPGLADLAGKGTFVPCAPYGTCWQPNDGWVQQHTAAAPTPDSTQAPSSQPDAQSADTQSAPIHPLPESQGSPTQSNSHSMNVSTTKPKSSGVAPYGLYNYYDDFPCSPYGYWYRRSILFYPTDLYPYDWAVCHAGWWLYRNNHYLWVSGTHKHHHCPVHWVKYNGKLGYVPTHPRDRHGSVPVNLRHGIYTLSDKPNHPVERVAFEGKSPPKILDDTPKDFRNPSAPLLARADSPQLGVHFMHESPHNNNLAGTPARTAASSLTFDDHHERFVLATRVTEGGHTHTFSAPMSDHGGHIAAASEGGYHPGSAGGAPSHAGFTGGGGYSGGRSGGGYSGGGSSSHASSGGGGGYSGGGGHSGGGGGGGSTSSASSSSSSAGASSGGSAGGGGHH